jgi:hypothetical protein
MNDYTLKQTEIIIMSIRRNLIIMNIDGLVLSTIDVGLVTLNVNFIVKYTSYSNNELFVALEHVGCIETNISACIIYFSEMNINQIETKFISIHKSKENKLSVKEKIKEIKSLYGKVAYYIDQILKKHQFYIPEYYETVLYDHDKELLICIRDSIIQIVDNEGDIVGLSFIPDHSTTVGKVCSSKIYYFNRNSNLINHISMS